MVSEVTKLLNTSNVKHQEAMVDLKKENASLNRENKELRMKNGELNLKINSLTWKSFRKSGQCSHALIGSSIIRDVAQDNLVDTEVICKRGARISDIKSAVEQLTPGYETITLVTGGNDCEDEPARPAEAIVKSYGELIDAAKMKCQSVTSSVDWCARVHGYFRFREGASGALWCHFWPKKGVFGLFWGVFGSSGCRTSSTSHGKPPNLARFLGIPRDLGLFSILIRS